MEKEVKEKEQKGKSAGDGAEAELEAQLHTLEKLILDTSFNKYDVILLVRRWAYELKSKEGELRSLHELIAVAIRDILSSSVSHKMVRDLPHFSKGRKPKPTAVSLLDALPKTKKESEKKGSEEE